MGSDILKNLDDDGWLADSESVANEKSLSARSMSRLIGERIEVMKDKNPQHRYVDVCISDT